MATSVLRDVNDEGRVSVFIADNNILFTCEKGHWWIVEASETGSTGQSEGLPDGGKKSPAAGQTSISSRGDVRRLARLERTFGSEPLKVMGVAKSSSAPRAPRGASSPQRQQPRE